MTKNLSAQVIFLGKTIAKRRMICYNKSVQKFIPERVIIMPTWLNDAVFYEIYPQSMLEILKGLGEGREGNVVPVGSCGLAQPRL